MGEAPGFVSPCCLQRQASHAPQISCGSHGRGSALAPGEPCLLIPKFYQDPNAILSSSHSQAYNIFNMAPAAISESIENGRIGPHPSYIEIAKPYIFESRVQECLTTAGVSEAKDDSIRLQGIAWIDSVRKFMRL